MDDSHHIDSLSRDSFSTHLPGDKITWTLFVHMDHGPLFEQVCKVLLERRPWLHIALVTASPRYISFSGQTGEEILAMGSDLCFFDAEYLLNESQSGIYTIISLAQRKRITSVVLLYRDESDLDLVKAKLAEPVLWDGPPIPCPKTIPYTGGNDEHVADLVTKIERATDVFYDRKTFICHASEDREFCVRLAEHLVTHGIPVWYDEWSLKVGDSLVAKINEGIGKSQYMGVVLSRNSVDKPWCVKEMNTALYMQLSSQEIAVLPILIDDCRLPPFFSELVWADFRSSFDEGLRQLLQVLRS